MLMQFNKKICSLLFFILLLCFAALGNTEIEQFSDKKLVRVFVLLNDDTKQIRSDMKIQSIDFVKNEIQKKIESEDGSVLVREFKSFKGFLAEVPESMLSELEQNPDIKNIYQDYRVHTFLQTSVPLINATPTWKIQQNGVNLTGKGQTICIIDTGVDTDHLNLQGNIISQYCYCNNDPIDPPNGCCPNNLNESTSAEDDNGHGTHVAGIVAASGSIKGVAPEAKIVAIKALDYSGAGWNSDIVLGIEWCVSNASRFNISVISMSLGGNTQYTNYCDASDSATAAAINSAIAQNISVVVAAGNDNSYTGISSPACIQNSTPVAATTKNDVIDASYSNRNWMVTLAAPGTSINSTMIASPYGSLAVECGTGNAYCSISGTSMATPHVAGAFALINQYLNLSNRRRYTPQQIEQIFNSTGKRINDSTGSNLNYTRIDIYAAVKSLGDLSNPTITLNSPINVFNSSSAINITFNCTASDNINITNVTLYGNWSGGWHANQTNSSGINNSNYIFNKNISDGKYLWNCKACDNSSNCAFANSNFSLTVDTKPPYFNPVPTNQTSDYGNSFSYDIDAFDSLTSVSIYSINDSRFYVVPTSGLITNNSILNLTTYSINVSVNDTLGNMNSTAFNVVVRDITAPYFNHTINSSQYLEYGSAFYYDLNATDNYAVSNYSISDTINFNINSTTGVLTNKTNLGLGNYQINVSVNDSSGNSNSTLISLTVQDTIKPYFNPLPTNKEANYSQSFSYQINATDNHNISSYSVNDTSFAINSSGYLKNNTLLSVKTYSINITINDTSNNLNSTIITVTVKQNLTQGVNANTSSELDLSASSSNLTLYLSQSLNVTVIAAKETPTSAPSSLNTLKAVNITLDSYSISNLTWALIKIYYSSSELTSANIDGSTLKIYFYNISSSAWQLEPNQGVDTTNYYVWANVTHFSLFGAFGSAPSSGGSTTGGGGGGGGSSSTTNAILLTRSPLTYTGLSQNTKFIFSANNGVSHTLTLNKVDTTKIDLILASDPIKFSLLIGEEKILNLSSDEQIYTKLESIINRKADLTLKSIVKRTLPVLILPPKKNAAVQTTNPKTSENLDLAADNEIKNDTNNKNQSAEEKSSAFSLFKVMVGAIVLVLVISLFFFFKKNDDKYALLYARDMIKDKQDHDDIRSILKQSGRTQKEIEKILNKAKRLK
jgi:subtilisin family serine protease